LENPDYQANTPLRCYFCKHEVYGELVEYARQHDFQFIIDGTNLDDLGDIRPGRKAAAEYGVRSPLIEAQFTNRMCAIWLARSASRTGQTLGGVSVVAHSARHAGDDSTTLASRASRTAAARPGHSPGARAASRREIARLEVPPDDFDLVLSQRDKIVEQLPRYRGTRLSRLDLGGYRMGSLNELHGAKSNASRREAAALMRIA